MAHLHLSILEHLLLQIANLALLVTRLAFHWSESAVVFVPRSDGHVVETAI